MSNTDRRKKQVDLLTGRLALQFPRGNADWGHCSKCGQPARGKDWCADCLTEEIGEVTGAKALAHHYRALVQEAQETYLELVDRIGQPGE